MATRNYTNTASQATTTGAVLSSDTSISLASFTGYPAAPFTAALARGTALEEIVLVTAVSGSTVTVTRGYDGTTAKGQAPGTTFEHVVIAQDYRDAAAAATAVAGANTYTDTQVAGAKAYTDTQVAGRATTSYVDSADKAFPVRDISLSSTNAGYNLTAADMGSVLRVANAGSTGVGVYLPTDTAASIPVGTWAEIEMSGASAATPGLILIQPLTGVTLNGGTGALAIVAKYDRVRVQKVGANTWEGANTGGIPMAYRAAPNGVASLGSDGLVPASQLPTTGTTTTLVRTTTSAGRATAAYAADDVLITGNLPVGTYLVEALLPLSSTSAGAYISAPATTGTPTFLSEKLSGTAYAATKNLDLTNAANAQTNGTALRFTGLLSTAAIGQIGIAWGGVSSSTLVAGAYLKVTKIA